MVDHDHPTIFSNNRLLPYHDVSPTSTWFKGMPWYSDLSKAIQDALITNQEDNIAMITVNEAKVLIKNSIENYKNRKVDIQDETRLVIENNMASTENTALHSISYILQWYKTDSHKANEQITSQILSSVQSGIPFPPDYKTF